MAVAGKLIALEPITPGVWREVDPPARFEPGTVTVLGMSGSAYFASVYRAQQIAPDFRSTTGAGIVLQMRNRRFYSLTGLDWVKDLISAMSEHGHVVVLSDVELDQRRTMEKTGLMDLVGADALAQRRDRRGDDRGLRAGDVSAHPSRMMGGTATRHYGDHGGRTAVCCAADRSMTSMDEGVQR